jgi:hypothetical protein
MSTIQDVIEYIEYYNNKNCAFINPKKLINILEEFPCHDISDEIIETFLKSKKFVNTNSNWFTELYENNIELNSEKALKYRARRIATLIYLLQKKVEIHEIHIYSSNKGSKVYIENGQHRFRAYLYLNKLIPATIFCEKIQ